MKKQIIFLLFPKTQLMDFAGPAQVFYEAGQVGGKPYNLIYAATSEQIATEQGVSFAGLRSFASLRLSAGDLICLPGIDFESFKNGEADKAVASVKDWIWEQRGKGVHLASVCTGALMLAKMGLLDRVQCTTHWKCLPYFKAHFPKAKLRDDRLYCFDKGIFTSAGMTSGIDMALALVEQWDSPLIAAKVAQEMVINVRRAETREQQNIFLDFENHFNADVYQIQEILANRLDARYTIDDLAVALNKSPRHLARLFKKHTGKTIQAYRDGLRLELGAQLLMHSEMSIKEIAVKCGFENARQFIRLWKTHKGCPPGQYRKAATS